MKSTAQHFTIYTIKSGIDGPEVLITAGVHGDEYEPIIAAQQLAEQFVGMLQAGCVTIIPIVNKSAYQRLARCAEDELDLARTCPGNPNGSITEVIAYDLSKMIEQADYYIDMHTGGAVYEIFPLTGYLLHPDNQILEKQLQMAKAFNLPIIWGTDHKPNGRTLSVARDANVPAIYAEYGGGITSREEIVNAYYCGCLGVLQHLRMLDVPKIQNYHINEICVWEDPTPDNGNLQTKMPSPIAGIFLAKVKLGDVVTAGSVWGKVINPLTGKKTQIIAEKDGLVFLLRVKSNVKQGDSLGGTLQIIKKKLVFDEK